MKKIVMLLFSSVSLLLYAQSPERVDLLNTGKMYIAPSATNGISMYVEGAVKCDSVANITLNGILEIGGDFVQDSKSHVFTTGDDGYTTSEGKVVFTSNRGVARHITTTDFTTFDRGTQYIAFPHIQIDTNDTIIIPAKMGIDALSLKRSSRTGVVLLKSDMTASGESPVVHDASLRITTRSDNSESLVDLGAVIVEQYLGAYRNGSLLFPFASPFKNTQLSGYFAGNWVRRLLRDDMLSTAYILGNKPNPANPSLISGDQYVTNPLETLKAGLPYLIKPRPNDYDYDSLKNAGSLAITGASPDLYNQEKFTFDGNVYTLPHYDERLFADDVLFSYSFDQETTITRVLNWIIGNSYMAPLSVDSLINEMNNGGVAFAPYIYIYPPGATSYLAVSTVDDGLRTEYDEIPAKSIFMIRVAPNQTIPAGTTFKIGKKDLRHGTLSNNFLRSSSLPANRDISFRVTPEDNRHIFDLTVIGLRATASLNGDKYDIPKIYTPEYESFQLYTKTPASSKLSANGVPPDVDSVILSFKPQHKNTDRTYILTVSQKGTEDELWLKDLKTNVVTDLLQTPSYAFSGSGTDLEDRFIVYFTNPDLRAHVVTPISSISGNSNIYVNFSDNRLSISGLTGADANSNIFIYDTQGKTVFSGVISQYPLQEFNITLPKNVYMISIQGQRNFNSKLIK